MGVIFGKKSPSPVKVAVLGEGPGAERLARGYQGTQGVELTAFEPLNKAEQILAAPGLQAVEIAAPFAEGLSAALQAVQSGFFTSVEIPDNPTDLQSIKEAADKARAPLRMRMLPFYYPPYQKLKQLVDSDVVGNPINLKLTVKWGKGSQTPPGGSAAVIFHRELSFLALAPYLMGPVQEAYIRHEDGKDGSSVPSYFMGWKHSAEQRYGYLQIDYCPGLHIRTRCEPVHRTVQLTGLGGIITATRGEGQLMRMPALMIRGKNATTAFETVVDKWQSVYFNLAQETVSVIRDKGKIIATSEIAEEALNMLHQAHLPPVM